MEYNTVIVPLDGSKLAETILPHVEKIAKGCSIPQVVLVTVTEPVRVKRPSGSEFRDKVPEYRPPLVYYGPFALSGGISFPLEITNLPVTIGKMAKTGYTYLVHIAEQLDKKGIPVTVALLVGDVADELVHFAKEEEADLIMMASRGRTGLRRWDVGNAAPKVFRSTDIPIMMVKPPPGFKETKPVRRGKAS
jgi:nucleotide-binding universal stress UspA family protein